MTREEEILSIEERIRGIFAKDNITRIDVNVSNELLGRWKYLTKYVSDKTPVTTFTVDEILDKTPPWTKKEDLNSKC